MPVAQLDISGDDVRTRVYGYLGAERGTLQSACAFLSDISSPGLSNWVEIGICSDKAMPDSRLAVLAGGYVQQNAPISWTGNIRLDKTWRVYIALQSSLNSRVRLAITTHQAGA